MRSADRKVVNSNSRPDEEGIKTYLEKMGHPLNDIPTADLMKKGLRLLGRALSPQVRTIPTADLMKKGLRPGQRIVERPVHYSNSRPDEEGIKTAANCPDRPGTGIPTADLMKKGLRRCG